MGNYISIYKNQISKNEARKSLGLNKNDFVFLFFGAIRKNKGIESLLPAFKQLIKKTRENIKLVLAGDYAKEDIKKLSKSIENYKKILGPKLVLDIRFIENDKVQNYLNSADIVVLPFKKITTSGSAILALSFARPIIAPRMVCLNELPDNVGFFYNPDEKNALYKAMEKAVKNKRKLNSMGKKAFEYAKSLSWDKIAEKTNKLFQSLIN
jgi:glycosyltransferase involved in cell wall biosynthesis